MLFHHFGRRYGGNEGVGLYTTGRAIYHGGTHGQGTVCERCYYTRKDLERGYLFYHLGVGDIDCGNEGVVMHTGSSKGFDHLTQIGRGITSYDTEYDRYFHLGT